MSVNHQVGGGGGSVNGAWGSESGAQKQRRVWAAPGDLHPFTEYTPHRVHGPSAHCHLGPIITNRPRPPLTLHILKLILISIIFYVNFARGPVWKVAGHVAVSPPILYGSDSEIMNLYITEVNTSGNISLLP